MQRSVGKSQRRWIVGVALALVAVAAALAALVSPDIAKSTNAASPSTVRIGYQLIPNGDLVVKDKKWLEKALPGTKVQWVKFESGGDVNTAIVAGAIDIGLAGSSPVTKGLAPPLNIPYVVPWIFDVIGTNEALVVKKSQGVTSLAGLAGKTIATPFASTSHYSLLAALAGAGVAASKVKIVDLEPQDIVAAWARGDIDGAYVWTPFLAELGRPARLSSRARSWRRRARQRQISPSCEQRSLRSTRTLSGSGCNRKTRQSSFTAATRAPRPLRSGGNSISPRLRRLPRRRSSSGSTRRSKPPRSISVALASQADWRRTCSALRSSSNRRTRSMRCHL